MSAVVNIFSSSQIRVIMNRLGIALYAKFLPAGKTIETVDKDTLLLIMNGISAFIFLRLFCRAMAMPVDYGLFDTTIKNKTEVQRSLMLISKLLMSASMLRDACKEDYLNEIPLNPYKARMIEYLKALIVIIIIN